MTKPPGYFSCKTCPNNAFCPGRDRIYPLSGYWRASNESTLILACLVSQACLGFHEAKKYNNSAASELLVKGECLNNHEGALCYECTRGSARSRPRDICEPCSTNAFIYVKLVFGILFMLIYICELWFSFVFFIL